MQNEIPLPYYLQQHEITKNQLTNFSQMPNAVESLPMTMNPYLMVGSSKQSNKPLEVENDYESVTYEQPFHSQNYKKKLGITFRLSY